MLAAQVDDRSSCFTLLQDANDWALVNRPLRMGASVPSQVFGRIPFLSGFERVWQVNGNGTNPRSKDRNRLEILKARKLSDFPGSAQKMR